jgi:Putative Actinobacterial Holin-X, holin superfamily III
LDAPGEDPREDSIGDLVGRLIEDGRSYAEAELKLLKAIADYRAQRAGRALALLAAGGVLLLSAVTALVIGAVLGLALHVGPVLAGLLVAAALAATGYALVRAGMAGIKGLGRDKAEQDAIDQGSAP